MDAEFGPHFPTGVVDEGDAEGVTAFICPVPRNAFAVWAEKRPHSQDRGRRLADKSPRVVASETCQSRQEYVGLAAVMGVEAADHAVDESLDGTCRASIGNFFGPELPGVLALADIVISRSGAGTIAELTAMGKPPVLIPLATSAGNEQEHNALHLQEAGAAVALLGDTVTSAGLRAAVAPLIS
ncbi:glycosyltransferase [Streptomyces anandii]|uniref:Glycosyltransferase n=1 Tax=Streptomyces anandii TaxID=285454 RepID=A0ABW6H059_9ACTN